MVNRVNFINEYMPKEERTQMTLFCRHSNIFTGERVKSVYKAYTQKLFYIGWRLHL